MKYISRFGDSATPFLPQLMLLAIFMGIGFGSLAAVWLTLAGVGVLALLPPLRLLFVCAWATLWSIFWFQFTDAGFRNLFPGFLWGPHAALFISLLFGLLTLNARFFQAGLCAAERQKADQIGLDHDGSPAAQEEGSFNPFQVLGVRSDAPRSEIHAAYRRQLALYHPDRVQHLGPELQRVALEKSLEIGRAFDILETR